MKKTVRFDQLVTVAPFERASCIEAKDIWFTSADIASFRLRAREMAVSYRKLGDLEQKDVDYRGFEGYTSTRQRHRMISNRCAVAAHKKGMDATTTAAMYHQCSNWSSDVAFVQAMHDYVESYGENENTISQVLVRIPAVASMVPPPPANDFCAKIASGLEPRLGKRQNQRCMRDVPTAQRYVRRRLC